MARTNPTLTKINGHSLDDPRVHTLIADGYQFIRRDRSEFDMIYIDFPNAVDYNLSKLYSMEFFHFVRERLAEGGVAVLDAPGIDAFDVTNDGYLMLTADNTWDIYYATLREAGFETILPFVSNLEVQNELAYETLDQTLPRVPGETASGRRNQILMSLTIHVMSLQQGFILLSPESREFNPEFGRARRGVSTRTAYALPIQRMESFMEKQRRGLESNFESERKLLYKQPHACLVTLFSVG